MKEWLRNSRKKASCELYHYDQKIGSKRNGIIAEKILQAVTSSIFSLSENPRPQGCKKLKGSKRNFWRIRIGDYRVLYMIEDEIRIVDVHKVGHRKDVYE